MDEEEYEEDGGNDFELTEEAIAAYPWSKAATVAAVVNYAADLQSATAAFFASMAGDAMADHNAKVDQKVMHEQAAKEIETITSAEVAFQEPEG